jgi:hypothetical protein
MRSPKIQIALWAATVAMGLGACGDTPEHKTIAKALEVESKTAKAQEQLAETEKKKQEEKRREAEEKKAKKEAEIEAALRLPDVMPADMQAACDAMLASYDDFMRRGNEKDALEYYDGGRRKKLALVRRDKCEQPGSLEAAACSSVALMQPLESLADLERTEAARIVIERCVQKFPKASGGA